MPRANKHNHIPYERPKDWKRPVWLIQNSHDCLDSAIKKPNEFLKSLNYVHKNEKSRTNGRLKRIEIRQGIRDIGKIMTEGMDVKSLVFGKPSFTKDGEFYVEGLQYLSDRSGRPLVNVKRILSNMFQAEYINVRAQKGVNKNGDIIRYFSIREFTPKFFKEIGVKSHELEQAKARKLKEEEIKGVKNKVSFSLEMAHRLINGHENSPAKLHAKKEGNLSPMGGIMPISSIVNNLNENSTVSPKRVCNTALSEKQSVLLKYSNEQMMNLYSAGISTDQFSEFFKKINHDIRADVCLSTKQQELIDFCTETLRRQPRH